MSWLVGNVCGSKTKSKIVDQWAGKFSMSIEDCKWILHYAVLCAFPHWSSRHNLLQMSQNSNECNQTTQASHTPCPHFTLSRVITVTYSIRNQFLAKTVVRAHLAPPVRKKIKLQLPEENKHVCVSNCVPEKINLFHLPEGFRESSQLPGMKLLHTAIHLNNGEVCFHRQS